MTQEEWEDEKDRELDAGLTALFQSVESPKPPAGFALRTMKAVRRTPLPAGRRALRHRWVTPLAWAALIAGAASVALGAGINQPLAADVVTSGVATGLRLGVWFLQVVLASFSVFEMFAKTGLAVARAMATREAAAGLTLMAVTAGLSLSMLRALLFSKKESSSW